MTAVTVARSAAEPAGRLAAVLAHELRNPLAAALASVAALAELTTAHDPRRAFVDRAQDDLERLAELLERCLELGRSGAPRREPLDLAALAHRVGARHAAVQVSAEGPAPVEGDVRLLERALENLIENAVHAGGRTIAVTVAAGRRGITVDVADDGPGVPAELRARLFEPFFSGRGGSGLGLHVVERIVRGHGGTVELMPSLTGARFRLTLPEPAPAVLGASSSPSP